MINFQVGSGEIPLDDEEWEEWKGIASEEFEDTFRTMISCSPQAVHPEIIDTSTRKRGSLMSALYSVSSMKTVAIRNKDIQTISKTCLRSLQEIFFK